MSGIWGKIKAFFTSELDENDPMWKENQEFVKNYGWMLYIIIAVVVVLLIVWFVKWRENMDTTWTTRTAL